MSLLRYLLDPDKERSLTHSSVTDLSLAKKNYTARQKRLSVDAIPRDLFDDEAAGSGKELESDSRSAVDSLLRKPAISLRLLSLTVALHTRCIHQCRRSTSSRIKCSNIDQKSTMHLSTYTASTAFNAGPPWDAQTIWLRIPIWKKALDRV